MAAAVRAFRFEVSDYFFRLTTEGIRLFSNSVRKHSSLDELFEKRAMRAKALVDSYEPDDLKAHLSIIPFGGETALNVQIAECSAKVIEEAIPALERVLGVSASFAEVLSLLLFDLIVEKNATELMTKLGMTSVKAKEYRPRLKKKAASIVPVR